MPVKDYNNYMREYMLKRYHERRASAIKKLGGKCVDCGSKEDLQIDHRDHKEKSFSLSKFWSVSQVRFDAEIEKCQLLCQPCHLEKTLREGSLSWQSDEEVECCGKMWNKRQFLGHNTRVHIMGV